METVKNKKVSFECKKLMLESIKMQLQERVANTVKMNEEPSKLDGTTFFTEAKSAFLEREEEEELIDQILAKQKKKIELDQEIETCEDDLMEI